MATRQRRINDIATDNRRETEDNLIRDNRIKNDEQTQERRDKADDAMQEHRLRNDEMTIARRKINDRNPWRTLAISLLILAILAIGIYYYFV
ncbi:MAG: hypothetical protein AABX11_07700 [Nanoarchaeota archaeon]